ncbi:MAG: histidine phosphatase family protein [Glaciecola sp.]
MAQLTIVRHAQASFGAQDYDNLSELGHEQSKILGAHLKSCGYQPDHIITGDMKRHKQTAEGIIHSLGNCATSTDNSWDEFDFDAIVRSYLGTHPHLQPKANAPRSDWYKVLRSAMLAWSTNSLKDYTGESWQHFVSRVKTGAAAIANSQHSNVMVVSSGGAMAVFLMQILNSSVEQAIAFNLQIRNTSVNQYFFNKKGFQLSTFNNVSHLDTPEHLNKITYS